MSTWKMMTFQDPASPFADNLILFPNLTVIIIICIISLTLYLMLDIITNKYNNLFLLEHHSIEIIWTTTPKIILIFIPFPSLKVLYFIDEMWNPTYFTIKAIGHQWYWSYEYPEFNMIQFDSYILNDLYMWIFRLLDVDNRLIIAFKMPIRLLTTSADVIHSWTIPSVGIKMDATPGRINQMTLFSNRPSIYFGQCSEICEVNHSFMPIALECSNFLNFKNWMEKVISN